MPSVIPSGDAANQESRAFQPEQASNRSLVIFFTLAFALSWSGYIPLVAHTFRPNSFRNPLWVMLLILPGIGPAVAAVLSRVMEGAQPRAALYGFVQMFTKRQKPAQWLVVSALAFSIPFAAAVLTGIRSGSHPPLFRSPYWPALLIFVALSLGANSCEEIGWRGFAQRRLQRCLPALPSALLVGCVWTVWHLPLFFIATGPMAMASTPLWLWAAGVPPQAVLLAWLFNRSGQSLAIASLFHILTNVFSAMLLMSWELSEVARLAAAISVIVWTKGTLGKHSEQ